MMAKSGYDDNIAFRMDLCNNNRPQPCVLLEDKAHCVA